MSGDARFQQANRLAARAIEGKGVVIVIDRQEVHTLNGVGMRVFELAEGRTIAEIATCLTDEFEVTQERAEDDARTFVRELLDLGALEKLEAS